MEKTTALGKHIRTKRLECGLTAGALAEAAGVTENAIRKLEAGDIAEPRFSVGVRIAHALGLTADELYGRPGVSFFPGGPQLAPVIAAIRSIRASLEAQGLEHVDVFGSVARGNAGPESDIDIMVTPRPDARFSLINLGRVSDAIEDRLGHRPDVLTRRGIENSPRMRSALEDAVRAF
jgi:predicted nucleotidyltransferase/DNA-binding XRE family transcriptional regulator